MLARLAHVLTSRGMPDFALRRALSSLGRRISGKPRQGVELELPCVRLGTDYGGYAVLKTGLNADSIVYSFGLGEDISFDLALMELTGCQVFGFDPTPRSIAWVRAQQLPPGFHLQELGVAGYDGKASFAPPRDPTHVSHSMVAAAGSGNANGNASGHTEFEVRRLPTLMNELCHDRLDLLKMDVEGAEYEVIDDLLAQGLRPRQLLVEFHHGAHGISLAKTESTLKKLCEAGYAIFDVQPSGHEFSLALSGQT
jgi:FkbM family methyltransferase